MELIKQNPIIFRVIIIIIALIVLFFMSDFIIKSLKLSISKRQLLIFAFGLYLLIDFVLSWL
ncbi:hypothetical protein GCM10011531_27650 [Aquaticitalea lipolytica]|uniref:Uncharacterized protein n=1 Tax=Aquaticitalea lipolytica TaxID=1247562 RepID=A0A8J2TUA1_9FLAO|nr:hypothetical protein GCM10011531_27650 [Aquaticitalea lipolytica]